MVQYQDFIFLEFQAVFSLILGFCCGPFSMGIEYAIIMLIIYEIFIFAITVDNEYKTESRIVLNIFYFFGWFLGRWLYTGKLGIEHYLDSSYYIIETREDKKKKMEEEIKILVEKANRDEFWNEEDIDIDEFDKFLNEV